MKKLYFTLSLILGFTVISCNSNEEAKNKLKPALEMSEEDKELEKEMEELDKDVEELDTLVEILKH
jgi:ABC-type phosphate/phosphonate transport system substrate-binding protein